MPSMLTHHLFGQKVLQKYGRAFEEKIDTQDAFIMGCQGPDPFFFAALGPHPKAYLHFGQLLHSTNVTLSLDFMLRFAERASGETREILFAYLAGYLCHYALDKTTHPYVYAAQYAECKKLGLKKDKAHFHMRLETAIDSLMTGQYVNPNQLMPRNKKVCIIISGMYQRAAKEIYNISLSKRCFWRAIRCTRTVEHFLKSRRGIKRAVLVRIERLFTKYSAYDAMSHSPDLKGIEDPLNLKKSEWSSPADGTVHTETFCELFDLGIKCALSFIDLLQSKASASEIINGTGFDGVKEKVVSFHTSSNI